MHRGAVSAWLRRNAHDPVRLLMVRVVLPGVGHVSTDQKARSETDGEPEDVDQRQVLSPPERTTGRFDTGVVYPSGNQGNEKGRAYRLLVPQGGGGI